MVDLSIVMLRSTRGYQEDNVVWKFLQKSADEQNDVQTPSKESELTKVAGT